MKATSATSTGSVFVGMSVDGFIARPNDTFDFLDAAGGGNTPHGFEEFMASVDALVMGRRTYEVVLPFGTWPYGDKPVFVLSSKPLPRIPKGAVVERLSGSPARIVSRLAARGFKHLYVDGGITVQRFLDAGLVQRLILNRVPVIIGTGISLFGPLRRDVLLEHVATREFAGGLVQSEYRVLPARSKTRAQKRSSPGRKVAGAAKRPSRRTSRAGRARTRR
jgi:dihydrofolate reductase